jgi:uncharacterized protein (TIGR02646 family)
LRNVARVPRPKSLRNNAARWKKEFLDALKKKDKKLISSRRTRYNRPDVCDALDSMYRNLCCYCESQVGPVGANQIEHLRPVRRFPGRTFEWTNLHLVCAACNRAKSKQWNPDYPILDPVVDVPIDNHLDYALSETGVRRTWQSERGHTTVDHPKLNRPKLREARGCVFFGVLEVIRGIRRRMKADPKDFEAANQRDELQEKCLGEYGSMIQWAIQDWLDPFV